MDKAGGGGSMRAQRGFLSVGELKQVVYTVLQFSRSLTLSVNDVAMCSECSELGSSVLYKFKDHYVHNHSC